jgi:Uma2 family endonuclease
VRISPAGPFFYPDASVVCGQPIVADECNDNLLNPTTIFEIFSRSTEAYDRGFKFAQYRTIESLQEYVLVSQTEPRMEVFLRQSDGSWNLREFVGMDAVCHLAGIDCNIALADVYEGVTLEG